MATQSLSQLLQGQGNAVREDEAPAPTDAAPVEPTPADHPVLRSLEADEMAAAHAEEVMALRDRVAKLEAALEAAHAAHVAQTRSFLETPPPPPDPDAEPSEHAVFESEFSAPAAPAVSSCPPPPPAPDVSNSDVANSEPTSPFADAWGAEDATFEERFAAKAFFQESSEDQASRRWLLDNA